MEEHGRGMDGHRLVGVRGGVGPVRLQLSGTHEEAVCQASADALRVPPGGQDWHGHLVREEARHGKDPDVSTVQTLMVHGATVPTAQPGARPTEEARIRGGRGPMGQLPQRPEVSAGRGAPLLPLVKDEKTHKAQGWSSRKAIQVQGWKNVCNTEHNRPP